MKRHPAIHAFATAGLFAAAASIATAAPPFPDLAYGDSGDGIARIPAISGYARRAVVQADGRLVLVGLARTASGQDTQQLVLGRLDAQGLRDGRFGPNLDGIYRTEFFDNPDSLGGTFGANLTQTGDGKLVYTGHSSAPTLVVGRLHADGMPDTDFAAGSSHRLIAPSALVSGAADAFFSTVLPLAGDKTLLIGTAHVEPAPGQYFSCAMRLLADGATDTRFGDAGRTCIVPSQSTVSYALAGGVLADGRILLAGASQHAGGSGLDMSIARLDADGALDTTFGPTHDGWTYVAFDQGGALNDIAYAIAVDGAGRILLAGYFEGASGSYDIGVARLLPDGQPDGSFGPQGRVRIALDLGGFNDDFAHSIAALPDGGILVGGRASTDTGDASVALLLKSDGTLDPRFGGGGVYPQGPPIVYSYQQILAGDHLYMIGNTVIGTLVGDFAATRAVLPLFADGFENPDLPRPAQP